MKHFGELLRSYIKKSGYSNYALAQKAGINRTTLQKVLSGERAPSPDFLNKIILYLRLTPEESDSLFSKIEAIQTGETVYARRQFIRHLLETTSSDLSSGEYMAGSHVMPGTAAPLSRIPDQQLAYGSQAVTHLLNQLVMQECAEPSPSMLACITGRLPLLGQVLNHAHHYCPSISRLRVKHLTSILKEEVHSDFPSANLEILSNLLPIAAISDFGYEISYFYGEKVLTDVTRMAFPFYIVFSQAIVLLSADCATALCCRSDHVIYHFRNLFEAAQSNTMPLITRCPNAPDILPHMIQLAENDPAIYVLEYHPCLPAYFTEEMIRSFARPDVPEYEHTVQTLVYRAHQLRNMTNHTCLFNKSGLLDFVRTGYLADFPPEYVLPLSKEARQYLLEELYNEIASGRQRHRMVNPLMFPISENLTCILHEDKGLDFSGFAGIGKSYNYIHIEEQSLLEAFSDFFQYLVTSSLVYSLEDTLAFIRQCIDYLNR